MSRHSPRLLARRALGAGQTLVAVSGQIRHADTGVIAQVYSHLNDSAQLVEVARSIGQVTEEIQRPRAERGGVAVRAGGAALWLGV